jgi:hypothetical protein
LTPVSDRGLFCHCQAPKLPEGGEGAAANCDLKVQYRYTDQLSRISLNYANILFINYSIIPLHTLTFSVITVTYCFISKLIILWSTVQVRAGPP